MDNPVHRLRKFMERQGEEREDPEKSVRLVLK